MPPLFYNTFDEYYDIPKELQEAFWLYFRYGIEPGGFGMAVLRNDFIESVLRAHPVLQSKNLKDIARWFSNTRLPKDAWGSTEKINNWIHLPDDDRREIMEELKLCPTLFDILRSVPLPVGDK